MLYFIDTEFTDLAKDCSLLSIGVVSEDGKSSFYGEVKNYEESKCSDFVKKTILPTLKGGEVLICHREPLHVRMSSTYFVVANAFTQWLLFMIKRLGIKNRSNAKYAIPEIVFVSDVCQYDAVLVKELIAVGSNDLNSEDKELLEKTINPMWIDLSSLFFFEYMNDTKQKEYSISDASYRAWACFDRCRESVFDNMSPLSGSNADFRKLLQHKHDAFWDACVIRLNFLYTVHDIRNPKIVFPDVKDLIVFWNRIASGHRLKNLSITTINEIFNQKEDIQVYPTPVLPTIEVVVVEEKVEERGETI